MVVRMVGAALLLPAIVAGLGLSLCEAWRKRRPDSSFPLKGTAFALAVSYLIGHWGVWGRLPLHPLTATDWLPYFAFLAALVSLIEPLSGKLRHGVWIAFLSFAFWLLLRPMIAFHWGPMKGFIAPIAFSLIGIAFLWNGERLAEILSGVTWGLLYMVIAFGGSLALLVSRSASLAQLMGVIGAGMGMSALVSLMAPSLSPRAIAPFLTVSMMGLWLSGIFYATLPFPSAALFAAAPVAGWLVTLPALRRRWRWQRESFSLLGVGLLTGIGVVFALMTGSV